jgi:hypothetical protein
MRREHKVTKDIFKPAKSVPTIRLAANDNRSVRRAAALPSFRHTVISPAQPHSKVYAR